MEWKWVGREQDRERERERVNKEWEAEWLRKGCGVS
jgi:hypothetical protein